MCACDDLPENCKKKNLHSKRPEKKISLTINMFVQFFFITLHNIRI